MEPLEIPDSMRAAVLLDDRPQLTTMTIPTPRPEADEALVKVTACGVCHTDLHVIRGEVAFPRPAVLGHEISGEVVAFGPGSSDTHGLQAGDTVVAGFIMPCTRCQACRRGRDDLCTNFFAQNRLRGTLYDGRSRLRMPDGSFLAMYSMGGLAEYAVVPVSALTRLPAVSPVLESCVLGCAGLTSFGAVFRTGQVGPGDSVAVVGVGGIGSSLIEMARAAGATTIVAVDIADDKLDRARALGATSAVNATRNDPVAEVLALTGGADVAFEALGTPATFEQAVRMLADGGRMVTVGIATQGAAASVEITPLVRRGYSISGSYGGRTRTDLPEVVALAADGRFSVTGLVSRVYGLEDADAAYVALASREIIGRAVIGMGSAH